MCAIYLTILSFLFNKYILKKYININSGTNVLQIYLNKKGKMKSSIVT